MMMTFGMIFGLLEMVISGSIPKRQCQP